MLKPESDDVIRRFCRIFIVGPDECVVMENPKDYFEQGWLEYLRHLPEDVGHPIEVLVLRGHILIERQLNRLIELQLPNPEALELERMRFGSKVRLAEALCGHQVHEWVWIALRSVNNVPLLSP